jgi:cyclomaltodextrinase / maltogenic alpha-amylase / neopullulanase
MLRTTESGFVVFNLTLLFFLLSQSDITSQDISHSAWSQDATIYEVNIRQYTPEGTFAAFEKHLPELKQLGVDIVWLMPINPIGVQNRKGSLGSYYSVKDYKAVNPEFGTSDDFKKLINNIHQEGMHVIIDWVANHTSWDNVWVKTHPEFFTKDSNGNFIPPVTDWEDVIDLNYNDKGLWNYMIDAMNYWLKEYNIDGFRCDVAAMVPTEFWIEARKKLSKSKNDVFMLAEASENYLHQAFDMTYNWPLKDIMNDVAKGEKNAGDIKSLFENEKKEYNANDYRMVFTSNHDENSWNGTEYERLGDAVETFAVLCGTVKGMPLIYTGQEAGMNKALRFFDKDTVEWKASPMRKIYTKLNKLKKNNKALWNGNAGGEMIFLETGNKNILSFVRESENNKVITIFNLSPQPEIVKVDLQKYAGEYEDVFNNNKINISGSTELKLEPWQYKVYSK